VSPTKKIVLLLFVMTPLNQSNVLIKHVLLMLKNANKFLLFVKLVNTLVPTILVKQIGNNVILRMDAAF
jgi:hypothetical protein